MPKTLIVFYSRTGNTRAVALAIAQALNADVEEIIDKKRRDGRLGFIVSGKDAMLKQATEIEEPAKNPADYDLVLAGTPVWANTMCAAVRTYLTRQKSALPNVAFFLTTRMSGVDSTFNNMQELAGKAPVATLAVMERAIKRGEFADAVRDFVARLQA